MQFALLQNWVASSCGNSTHVVIPNHLHVTSTAPIPPPAVYVTLHVSMLLVLTYSMYFRPESYHQNR